MLRVWSGVSVGKSNVLWRCMECLRPYWRKTLAAYLALLAINGIALAIPQIIRSIVDHGIAHRNPPLIRAAVLWLLLLAFLKAVITYFQGYWTETASQNVACDLRSAIHRQLARLSFSWHDRSESGQILTRAIQDVERIRFVTGRAFLRIIDGLVLVTGSLVLLALIDPLLALLAMSTMPLLVWRAVNLGRRLRPMSLTIQKQLGKLTARLEQNLRGVRVVKAFAQEDAETARFARENRRWFLLSTLTARLQAVQAPQIDMIANFAMVIVIGYGGYMVTRGQLTTGELVAFAAYLGQLTVPVRRMGNIVPAVTLAITSGERVFEILDAVVEVADAPDAKPLLAVTGEVVFENVEFGYVRNHRILHKVSFAVRPGQVVALLGTTGSGKSTIINLIPRFYDPTAGRVLIDGNDLRKVTLASLRDQIGTVLQETTLFATTVRENIMFGRPGASEQEMLAAARAAQAHDFIAAMPHGYDTVIGERGVTLSGGQKQRLAIARTLLRDPRILILDDATASVDTATEQQIQRALEHLMVGRTCFVIAQRLSTLRRADLILILDRGRLVAQGAHEELLRGSGLYAELYYQQERAGGL